MGERDVSLFEKPPDRWASAGATLRRYVSGTEGFVVDGELQVSYELLVYRFDSVEHQQRRFLPHYSRHHVFAFVQNTLVRLLGGIAPDLTAIVSVAHANDKVFTGWAGLSRGPQSGALAADDGIFVLGRPTHHTIVNAGGVRVEIAQYADSDAARASETSRPRCYPRMRTQQVGSRRALFALWLRTRTARKSQTEQRRRRASF
jgi:hypothetical protein